MAQARAKSGLPVWRDQAGRLFEGDERTARLQGWAPASEDEAAAQRAARAERAEFGTTGQQALGLAETAVRTATLGAVEGLAPGADARARTLQRVNPLAQDVAQVAGEVAVDVGIGALTGGLGTAASRGARAARAGVSLAGDAVAGLGGEANRAFIEGRPLRAYEAMAFGLAGGLAGRGSAVALGKAVKAARGLGAKKGLTKLAQAGDVPEALVAAERRALATELPEAYAKAARSADELGDLSDLAQVARHSDGIVKSASDDFTEALRHQADVLEEATSVRNKAARINVAENEAPQLGAITDAFGTGTAKLEAVKAAAAGTDAERLVSKFAADYERSFIEALEATTAKERFLALDAHKRLVQQTHVKVARAANLDPAGGLKLGELQTALAELGGDTRRLLERKDLWGAGAEYQEAINAQITRGINPQAFVESKLGKRIGLDFNAKRQVEFDADSAGSFLKKDQRASVTREQFAEYAAAQRAKVDVLERFGMLDAAGVKAAREALDKVEGAMTKARNALDAKERFDVRTKRIKSDQAAEASAGGAGGVGALAMQLVQTKLPMGGVVGPMMRTVADVTANLVDSAAAAAVGSRGSSLAARAAISARNRYLDRGVRGTMRGFGEGYDSPEDAYQSKAEFIRDAMLSPALWADSLAEDLSWMAVVDPELHAATIARQTEALKYLAANLPPAVGVSMSKPYGRTPDRASIRKFAQLYNAVVYPETVLEDIVAGTVTPSQMRAVKVVHPDMFQQLQLRMLDYAQQLGKPMSVNRKVMLSTMFELDGAAGPLYSGAINIGRGPGTETQQQPDQRGTKVSGRAAEAAAARPQGIRNIQNGVTSAQ